MNQLFDTGYFDEHELRRNGFKSVGNNVRIAKNCTIVGTENISIGNNVRIDAYTTMIAAGDGSISIGSHVHIGTCCLLIGGDGITMEDFSGLSHGVRLFSKADDLSGEYLVNPLVPEKYTNVTKGHVTLKRHCVVGSSSVVVPNVTIGEGSVVGALCLVTRSLPEWSIFLGNPLRKIKNRSKNLLELEKQLLKDEGSESK
jgi:acetyltransferase-like isoleucine patch superfamily enzyme